MGHMNNKEEEVYGTEEALVVDQDGFAKIIRHLAAQTFSPNDARLHLNEMVSEVHFELENNTNVPDGLPKEGVYVKTSGGNEYYAHFCIITFTVRLILSRFHVMSSYFGYELSLLITFFAITVECVSSEWKSEIPAKASRLESSCAESERDGSVQ